MLNRHKKNADRAAKRMKLCRYETAEEWDGSMQSEKRQDIFASAPKEEPARQLYFISALKDRLRRRFEADTASGRAFSRYGEKKLAELEAEGFCGTASVVTFGCQMNAHDSERLGYVLRSIGLKETEDELHADVVLFNTCTVRENANEHLYGRLGRLKQSKKQNPDMLIGICGCMMQETDEVEKVRKKYPYIDLIFGTHNLYAFAELLMMVWEKRAGHLVLVEEENGVPVSAAVQALAHCKAERQSGADQSALGSGEAYGGDEAQPHRLRAERPGEKKRLLASSDADLARAERLARYDTAKNRQDLEKLYRKPVVSVWSGDDEIVEELPAARKYPFKQGVNIMFGCNNFCTYCIVPYVRGREKSRSPEDILREVEKLGKEGVQEIMLLGQNVNSYGKTLKNPISFAALLKEVDALADTCGIARVRFMTSNPDDLSDELIAVMKEGKHICRQFHLPLQSGSNAVLKRMNRHYTREVYLDRAIRLKTAMPDISISTDIIVGFPGETEQDFRDTLAVVDAMRYDAAFTFIYSKRTGTPAAAFPDQVPEEVVKDRFDRLLQLQTRIAKQNCKKLEGRILPALFEEVNAQDGRLITGRLENNAVVHVPGDEALIGSIRNVRLDEAHGFYYTGELV